jgi:hypothetical protein
MGAEGYWVDAIIYQQEGKAKEAYAQLRLAMEREYQWKSVYELAAAYQMSVGQGTPQERAALAQQWAQADGGGSAIATFAEEVAAVGATDTARSIMQEAVKRDASLQSRAEKLYRSIGAPPTPKK